MQEANLLSSFSFYYGPLANSRSKTATRVVVSLHFSRRLNNTLRQVICSWVI